jgi:hypothetical protein
MVTARKPIASLRWWIGGLLFASTVINYIDRQTLSLLAPYLKIEYHNRSRTGSPSLISMPEESLRKYGI